VAELEIRLIQNADKSRFLRVRLSSDIKKGLVVQTDVPYQGTERRTEQAVFAAGGALAEYLGERYGENIDCDDVAKQARETFRELILEANQRLH
jgi:hypothetical protein